MKRWLDPSADVQEALLGLLALFYGTSSEELAALKVSMIDLDNNTITFPGRNHSQRLEQEIVKVAQRYLEQYRKSVTQGTGNPYLFIARATVKRCAPIHTRYLYRKVYPSGVSLRSLRATCLLDIASTGHVKLLEGLGLTTEGTRPYLNVSKDYLSLE